MVHFEFPCDVGETVYVVIDGLRIPAVREVRSIRISGSFDTAYDIRFCVKNVRTGEVSSFSIDDFGKTAFVNREDAMKAIENKL